MSLCLWYNKQSSQELICWQLSLIKNFFQYEFVSDRTNKELICWQLDLEVCRVVGTRNHTHFSQTMNNFPFQRFIQWMHNRWSSNSTDLHLDLYFCLSTYRYWHSRAICWIHKWCSAAYPCNPQLSASKEQWDNSSISISYFLAQWRSLGER